MGFFDFLKPIAEIVAPIIGIPTLGAVVGSVIGDTPEQTVIKASRGIGGPIEGTVRSDLTSLAGAEAGSLRQRTIVETFSPITNKVFKRKVTMGGVAVFNQDVAAANRLNRQLRRLNKKQPKKLVKQSQIAQLKEDVVESALRNAANGAGHAVVHVPKSC